MLRRAEEKQVCIWLACSGPVTAKAKIFRFEDLKAGHLSENPAKSIKHLGLGIGKSVRLGQNLFVALVIARPIKSDGNEVSDARFPTDELLAYDVHVVDENSGKTMSLEDLGLLSGKNSIVYESQGAVQLPTFFLRGKNSPLNFLHGSCRKLHGKGEDCLAAADLAISSLFADLGKRPSALFLTGDQIYADDVAGPLSHYLTELGIRLLGWEENINGTRKQLSEMQIGERQKLVEKYAHFTSPDADNHLLSFGEFAAMYLLAWNVENWPDRFPDVSTIPIDKRWKYRAQIKQLENTRKVLPSVRRALANVPTYMIFDDHDVTDDWNITREWHENVKTSKCGKQIVANALAAYWAFQGWGNDPSQYNGDFIDKVVDYLGKNGNMTEAAFQDLLWNFNNWTYTAPISPVTIVTDCRTQRQYDSYDGPPQLLSKESFRSILQKATEANYKKGNPIIIVSPTPVFGFLLLEALQKALANITGVYTLDLETWFANESGVVNFLSFLVQSLGPRHCIFLSGDVHYGFTISAAFVLLQKLSESDEYLHMSITQLTSSALKTTSLVKIAFVSEIMGRIRQLCPWKQEVRICWMNSDFNYNWLSSKSLRVRRKPTLHLDIQPRKKVDELVAQRPPYWIEARSIVRDSSSLLAPLLISDNNIGLVAIDDKKIIHNFQVRTELTKDMKVYQTIVEIDHGRNKLDELVTSKMHQFGRERVSTTLPGRAN
jgi:hypothetical protein